MSYLSRRAQYALGGGKTKREHSLKVKAKIPLYRGRRGRERSDGVVQMNYPPTHAVGIRTLHWDNILWDMGNLRLSGAVSSHIKRVDGLSPSQSG
jgi:hypothetical protein